MVWELKQNIWSALKKLRRNASTRGGMLRVCAKDDDALNSFSLTVRFTLCQVYGWDIDLPNSVRRMD